MNHGPDRRNVLKSTLALGLAGGAGITALIKANVSAAQGLGPRSAAQGLGPQVRPLAVPLTQELLDLLSTGNAAQSYVETGTLLADPNMLALAQNTLTTQASSLTGYQRDVLQTFIDMTNAPLTDLFSATVLQTIIQGQSLPSELAQDIITFQNILESHPSTHLLRAAGTQVLTSTSLASKISQAATALAAPPPSVSSTDPYLGPALQDTLQVVSSPSYMQTTKQLAALMQSTAYVDFLQSGPTPAEAGTVLLPPATLGSFSLPLGDNPDQSNPVVNAIASIVVAGGALGFICYSLEFVSAAITAAGGITTAAGLAATALGLGGIAVAAFVIFAALFYAGAGLAAATAGGSGSFTRNPFEE